MILLDFKCSNCDAVTEHFVPSDTQSMPCACGCDSAGRIISGTSFSLDGTDPGYPTAYDRWATSHEKRGGQDE